MSSVHSFKIIHIFDHHNRGQFILVEQVNFKEPLEIKEGSLLNGVPAFHYLPMYPFGVMQGEPRYDWYMLQPEIYRFPPGQFEVGQLVELVIPD